MKVAVTGASGFLGHAIVNHLVSLERNEVLAVTRQAAGIRVPGASYRICGNLNSDAQWRTVVAGAHVVVHTAARAHKLNDSVDDPLLEFRKVNVIGTLRLAKEAAAVGVLRFIFISSVGVHGMQTEPSKAFTEADKPNPHNAYALSKWEAEQGLKQIADETGLEVVIIRPPLIYGFNAPGNFGLLMRAVQRGWPLPLGIVHNQRSFVALDNLVNFIATCITHPRAANEMFLVSDGQDVSTTALVRGMARAAGVPANLLPVPIWALQAAGKMLSKENAVQGLCGNLQVDISKARELLGWAPPVSVEEGLRRAMGLSVRLTKACPKDGTNI